MILCDCVKKKLSSGHPCLTGVSSNAVTQDGRTHRWRRLAMTGLALYAIFLLTSQFEHHDLLCELKTPLHCTACTSSVVGSDPTAPAALGAWQLADAGSAV